MQDVPGFTSVALFQDEVEVRFQCNWKPLTEQETDQDGTEFGTRGSEGHIRGQRENESRSLQILPASSW